MELINNSGHAEQSEAKPAPQVNDISAPAHVASAEVNQPKPDKQPEHTNDANVAPAPQNNDTEQPADQESKDLEQPKPVKPPKTPRQHGSGGAIFAAVVIILVLGAMFTYAYLRSNNIAVF